jgi:hypothetical protein
MITISIKDVDITTAIIAIKGELLPGSAGNIEAEKMKHTVESLPKEKTRLVLNLLDLTYTFGDYFNGFVFLPLFKRQIKFNIVAKGETKEALNRLVTNSGMNKISVIAFYDTVDEAIRALSE